MIQKITAISEPVEGKMKPTYLFLEVTTGRDFA
jgi:hypothetical protein